MGLSDASLRTQLAALHGASYGWALGCCRWNRAEAEDVLQTVYLKVLGGSARFDERSSFRTWLFAVIRRTAGERRRRQWLSALLPERWALQHPDTDEAPDPAQVLVEGETIVRLRVALLQLSSRQREVLHLVFYEETTVDEAAAILGISVGSARTHYHRAQARLRELLPEECK